MFRKSLLIGIAAALAAAHAASVAEPVGNIPNAEDIALVDGAPFALISSMAGGTAASGKLFAVDRRSGAVHALYPAAGRKGAVQTEGCKEEVAGQAFAPHGLAVAKDERGRALLYAVNHGERSSVEIFSIEIGTGPGLDWIGCAPLPAGASGNSVAAGPDGSLYVTNMGKPMDGSPSSGPLGGDVLSWNAARGWETVPGSRLPAPNGILVSPDGKRLVVASWTGGYLVEIPLGAHAGAGRRVELPFLPDNLRWSSDGTILVTGHRATPEAVISCFESASDHCAIPSSVAEVDPESFRIACTGPIDVGLATVAAEIDGSLWIGTARGASVARISREKWSQQNCTRPS